MVKEIGAGFDPDKEDNKDISDGERIQEIDSLLLEANMFLYKATQKQIEGFDVPKEAKDDMLTVLEEDFNQYVELRKLMSEAEIEAEFPLNTFVVARRDFVEYMAKSSGFGDKGLQKELDSIKKTFDKNLKEKRKNRPN